MTFRKPPAQFTVERRPIMGAPGRSFAAAKAERDKRPVLAFIDLSGSVEVRLGVVTVAVIAPNPANRGRAEFIYRVFLPPAKAAPDPAATLEAAKTAIRHRVADWFDAAGDHARAVMLREGH